MTIMRDDNIDNNGTNEPWMEEGEIDTIWENGGLNPKPRMII